MRRLVLSAAVLSLALPVATASALVINGVASGWYQSNGYANPLWVGNYIAGLNGLEHRNYIIFDLDTVSQPILSASLTLRNPAAPDGYESPDSTETFELFDFSSDIELLAGALGGVAAFADLGSGTSYGSIVVSAADNGADITITLNAAAIGDLNASLGGLFVFGGAVQTLGGALNEYVFGNTGQSFGDRTLSFCTADGCSSITSPDPNVPEPSTGLLVLSGLLGFAAQRRRCA